jgi:SAM-dependent methyltransferase
MLKECQRTFGTSRACYLSQAIMENLPFPDAAFDRVLCLGALEYAEDSDQVVSELSRVMREDTIAIVSMQNVSGLYRLWDRRVYSGSFFNTLRRLRRRPARGEPLERLTSLRNLRAILSRHDLVVRNVVFYNFNLWLKPLDRLFPYLSVATSRKLEFLSQSMVGIFFGADFLVKAQKVSSGQSREWVGQRSVLR